MEINELRESKELERRQHEHMRSTYASYRNPYDYVVGCIAALDREWGFTPHGDIPKLQGRKTAFEEIRKHWEGLCPDLKIAGATRPATPGGERV